MEQSISQSIDADVFIPTPYTTVGQMKQSIKNWLLAGKNISGYSIISVTFSDGSILTPEVLLTDKYDNVNFLGQEKILPGAQIVIIKNVTGMEYYPSDVDWLS